MPQVEAVGACRSDEPHHISSVTLDPEDKADLCLLVRQTEIGWVRVKGYHCVCLTFLCGTADVLRLYSSASAPGKALINAPSNHPITKSKLAFGQLTPLASGKLIKKKSCVCILVTLTADIINSLRMCKHHRLISIFYNELYHFCDSFIYF